MRPRVIKWAGQLMTSMREYAWLDSTPHNYYTMVRTCVAAGCSNTNRDGVSLFQFPKDKILRKRWADQVKGTETNGTQQITQYCVALQAFWRVVICSWYIAHWDFGSRKEKSSLKVRCCANHTQQAKKKTSKKKNPPTKRRKSEAYEKRERLRVSFKYVVSKNFNKFNYTKQYSSVILIFCFIKVW